MKPLLELLRGEAGGHVKALAHITGGGFIDNIPRVLPEGCDALLDLAGFEPPAVFRWLMQTGGVAPFEMLRTFNCGVGMVLVTSEAGEGAVVKALNALQLQAVPLGHVVAGGSEPAVKVASAPRW